MALGDFRKTACPAAASQSISLSMALGVDAAHDRDSKAACCRTPKGSCVPFSVASGATSSHAGDTSSNEKEHNQAECVLVLKHRVDKETEGSLGHPQQEQTATTSPKEAKEDQTRRRALANYKTTDSAKDS
jgi:ferric-dicitrate binding protein FerR (iron transport regulator)